MLKVGDRVEVTSGFYNGLTGKVLTDCNDSSEQCFVELKINLNSDQALCKVLTDIKVWIDYSLLKVL